jgi:hypothetical protein
VSRRIYVASSARNALQPNVVSALREAGHDVYDFLNPGAGHSGFAWSQVDPNWQCWTWQEYARQVETHPLARKKFELNRAALHWCDTLVLLRPCARDSHLEAGFAAGLGKDVIIALHADEPMQPELMYLLCAGASGARFVTNTAELLAALRKSATTDNKARDLAGARPSFGALAEELRREELEKASRLMEEGYGDLLEKVVDGEIDIDTAMQIFDGRRHG